MSSIVFNGVHGHRLEKKMVSPLEVEGNSTLPQSRGLREGTSTPPTELQSIVQRKMLKVVI